MILDSRNGLRGYFTDSAGRPVRWVRWFDTDTHEYEAFRYDPDFAKLMGVPLRSLLYRGHGELTFHQTRVVSQPLPSPARRDSAVMQEARRAVPLILPPGWNDERPECEIAGCHLPAAWKVADEQEVEPERGADGILFERAVTKRCHLFCDWHYRFPTFTSVRGVETEVTVKARPQ